MARPTVPREQLERCWNACWHRARRPVEGVLISDEEARRISERVIRNVFLESDGPLDEAGFTARALEQTSEAVREQVAVKRRQARDPQIDHDPEDPRYDRNLDLDRLQKRDDERHFGDREWNSLPGLLRPLAFATLQRRGITGHDAEEVFNDSLAELVRERRESRRAPIQDPTVFEELIPLHTRIVGFRAVDWYRRRGALKNRPNAGSSFEEMTGEGEQVRQFEDDKADPDLPTFERIYRECREALDPREWELVYTLFVAQSATVQDLIADPAFCRRHGLSASGSTRRRQLNQQVTEALRKIRENLVF